MGQSQKTETADAADTEPAADAAAETTPAAEGGEPAARPPRIMVVNDSQEILDLFQNLLEDEGYEVFLYSYALRDMTEIERVMPDLIILDFMIGGENAGWQLLQKITMKRETAGMPVIICTAALQVVREMEAYLKTRGISVVLKPFDIDELLDTVKRVLAASAREHPTDTDVAPDE